MLERIGLAVIVFAAMWLLLKWLRLRSRSLVPPGPTDLVYGNGRFLAVGIGGLVQTSTDGRYWTHQNAGTRDDLWRVAFGNGIFIAISPKAVFTSTDGVAWSKEPAPVKDAEWITFGNGLFYLGGSGEKNWEVHTSPNGAGWTVYREGDQAVLEAGAFGNGALVVAKTLIDNNEVRIASTTDGRFWTEQPVITKHWPIHLQFAGDRFIIVSEKNELFTSPNGQDWTPCPPVPVNGSMAFGAGRYVLSSINEGKLFSSKDLSAWQKEGEWPEAHFQALTFGGGRFVVVADKHVATSTDGQSWNLEPLESR